MELYKKFSISVLMLSLVTLSLTGCNQETGRADKRTIGSIVGAIGGAWLGSNVGKGKGKYAAIAAGTLLGAELGKSIGTSLDRADMAYYNSASQNALEQVPSGEIMAWHNPDSGNSGTITPTRTYQVGESRYCREYTQTITVGGETVEGYGTACRQPDGTWKIESN